MSVFISKLSTVSKRALHKLADNLRDGGPQAPDTLARTINGPSGDIPPDNDMANKMRKIHAFRTITTILAHIQQERPFAVSNEKRLEEDRELKISNALATLAIADHDAVAVVTKRNPENLQVIACTQLSGDENPTVAPSEPSSFPGMLNLLFTKNFRKHDDPLSRDPTIDDAMVLAGIEIEGYKKLEEYLDKSL